MGNGSVGPAGPGQNLPGWLGPIVTVTTQVGVPTVIAGVLLWFVLFKMGGTLDLIQHQEEDRTRIVAAMQDSFIAALGKQNDAFDKSMQRNIEANKMMADRFIDALKDVKRGAP
jgi:hypothetical protein